MKLVVGGGGGGDLLDQSAFELPLKIPQCMKLFQSEWMKDKRDSGTYE